MCHQPNEQINSGPHPPIQRQKKDMFWIVLLVLYRVLKLLLINFTFRNESVVGTVPGLLFCQMLNKNRSKMFLMI